MRPVDRGDVWTRPGSNGNRSATAAAIAPGSDRTFGAFFAMVFAGAGAWFLWGGGVWAWGLLALGAVMAVIAFAAPSRLHGLNVLWMRFGLVLARIVNPIVLGLIFFAVMTPIGWLMRAFGKRPLSLAFEPQATTYWIERRPAGPPPETMTDQF